MSKFARKGKPRPGFEYLEPVLEALENELRDKVNEPHEGKRKVESLWPVHQINWQRTRYVYDMHYKYKKIDRKVWDYCCRNKIIDENLANKWRKPGYERLCSTYVINTRNYNFGTVSICRVPPSSLGESAVVECPTTGCRGCASSSDAPRNIFGNKYGQHEHCLISLNCKGPFTNAKCTTHFWNNGVSYCMGAGAPCFGCVNPDFPGTSPLFKT